MRRFEPGPPPTFISIELRRASRLRRLTNEIVRGCDRQTSDGAPAARRRTVSCIGRGPTEQFAAPGAARMRGASRRGGTTQQNSRHNKPNAWPRSVPSRRRRAPRRTTTPRDDDDAPPLRPTLPSPFRAFNKLLIHCLFYSKF